jgi:sterol desaturase/sphingolipid hydroxylase (fatty acid hydroxylase superfamily)
LSLPYRIIRRVAYPFLLTAVITTAVVSVRTDASPSVVSPLFLVGVIVYFTVLERLIPYERAWHPTGREWRLYGVYFVLNVMSAGAFQALITGLVGAIAAPEPRWPLGVEITLALLLGSFVNFAAHRWAHTNPWLWRVHGLHHTPDKVNVGNDTVNNVLDIGLTQGSVQLALALTGFSEQAVLCTTLFATAQGFFLHANVDVSLGRLGYVLTGPEQHRLHHSTDLREAGHFTSDLSVWDHLFGSFHWRPGRRPAAVGLAEPGSFPQLGSVVAAQLHPLRKPATAGHRGRSTV